MFSYQQNFANPTELMTSDRFAQLIVSDDVVRRNKEYRRLLPELQRLKQEIKNREVLIGANPDKGAPMNKTLNEEKKSLQEQCKLITSLKGGLPVLMYQATFDETLSKKGYRGRWRKQAAARLNGLFMLDVDHVDNPRPLYERWRNEHPELFEGDGQSLVLVHMTPSGQGLRVVAIADAAIGNIADNQAWLAEKLGVAPDKACKDASRCSFCPMFEDILFIDKEKLFNYDNAEYDKTFGPLYRQGKSQPTRQLGSGTADTGGHVGDAADVDDGAVRKETYHGKPYQTIIARWFKSEYGGLPKTGDRHQSLFRLACDLRYICDSPDVLARLLAECEVGREVAGERGQGEIDRLASDAYTKPRYRETPKRLKAVLQAAGVQQDGQGADGVAKREVAVIDYNAWWRRLEPLLRDSPVLREAVAPLPESHRLAGVLSAGAMLGTYLTRTWWEHFDGKDYRLSFLVYIIGPAASGKSFVTDLDRLIMAPMLGADRIGREWERQYKEDMKKRSASSKNAKQEAPDQQHPVVRYVPSTISNAVLYRRLTDGVDPSATGPDGQPMHLHLYTAEPELATALRAQQGSWAAKNDLELKSFHNEYAGVDFANDQSVNGIIQVNWNQVVSGTQEAMGRKIRPSMVLDGLVTRLVLYPMPHNDFEMIDRRRGIRDNDRECLLRSIGLKLDQIKGELKAERLVDFCYDYERRLCDEARLEQDHCLDYFRKRIPVIMMRYALVRIVCRDPDKVMRGEPLEVRDDDLEFARLIGDWCLMTQMYMYGEMVMDAQQREREQFIPRRRSQKVREAYAKLPKELTTVLLVSQGVCKDVMRASETLRRWQADGLVEENKEKKCYIKKFDEIPE